MPGRLDVPPQFLLRPFTRAEAVALGVSDDVLGGARFRRSFQGVYVPAEWPDTLDSRARAASLIVSKEAAFSHFTSADLLQLPVPAHSSALHVSVASGHPPDIAGIQGHEGLLEQNVLTYGELRIVEGSRTYVDLAPVVGFTDLVILGDAVVRRWGRAALESAVTNSAGRRGIVAARQALKYVEEDVDSPMETRVRLLIVRAGLPRPRVNKDVFVDGQWLARPDLSYPEFKLAIEYDGDEHRKSRKQWRDDIFRKEVLEDYGWRCIVLTGDDVFVRPTLTLGRVRGALVGRGWRG